MAGDGSRITASQVARKLGVSTQAASEMFRRLAADGLVTLAEGRELQLTKPGRTAADGIFRRHALCEWLLTEIVGLGWAESDAEAERLQAAISPRVEAQLDELLGHPETCPHGNPLDAEIARRRPPGHPLARSRPGRRPRSTGSPRRPRRTRASCRTSRRAACGPARHVNILARSESLDSLTLDGPLGRATLGLRPAALVLVLPARPIPRSSIGSPGR